MQKINLEEKTAEEVANFLLEQEDDFQNEFMEEPDESEEREEVVMSSTLQAFLNNFDQEGALELWQDLGPEEKQDLVNASMTVLQSLLLSFEELNTDQPTLQSMEDLQKFLGSFLEEVKASM